jgi:hypothetical protein
MTNNQQPTTDHRDRNDDNNSHNCNRHSQMEF